MANVSMNLGFAMIGLTVQTVQMKLTVSQKVVLMVQLKTVQVMAIVVQNHGSAAVLKIVDLKSGAVT